MEFISEFDHYWSILEPYLSSDKSSLVIMSFVITVYWLTN